MTYRFLLICLLVSMKLGAQENFTRIYNVDTTHTYRYNLGTCWPAEKTSDNGYLVKYLSSYYDGHSFIGEGHLIKTDSLFRPQWRKYAWPFASMALPDNSIVSFSSSIGSDLPYCPSGGFGMEKRSLSGNILWTKRICSDSDLSLNRAVYANSKIRAIGNFNWLRSSQKVFMVDLDINGNLLHADTLSVSDTPYSASNLFNDNLGNFYPVMDIGSFSGGNKTIVKMLPDNTIPWSYRLGFPRQYDITSIATLNNGDLIVGGIYIADSFANSRIFLVKISASGSVLWQKTADRKSRVFGMHTLENGNIVLSAAGSPTYGFTPPVNQPVIEIDSSANVLWATNLAPDSTAWPHICGLSAPYVKTNNQWYFTAVTRNPYAVVLYKTDSNAHGHCNFASDAMSFYDSSIFTITPVSVSVGTIPVNVTARTNDLPYLNFPTYVDSCDYALPPLAVSRLIAEDNIRLFPNPASDKFSISAPAINILTIDIADMTGKVMHTSTGQTEIDTHGLPPGNYIVRIITNEAPPAYRKLTIIR